MTGWPLFIVGLVAGFVLGFWMGCFATMEDAKKRFDKYKADLDVPK